MAIASHNRLLSASINSHCHPEWIAKRVHRWPLPASIDCETFPSMAIASQNILCEVSIRIAGHNALYGVCIDSHFVDRNNR